MTSPSLMLLGTGRDSTGKLIWPSLGVAEPTMVSCSASGMSNIRTRTCVARLLDADFVARRDRTSWNRSLDREGLLSGLGERGWNLRYNTLLRYYSASQ